ncbi:MAG: UDP-glucose 4-epimerase GalE [Rhodobacteraceae bacterium]|nr:UDP-glucose 4-epimerase GalE [Paracoccaceae bacterium]
MRILLTGGAGYIGSHTCVELLGAGHTVEILDNFANARPDVPERIAAIAGQAVPVHRADVRDRAALDAVLGAGRFDAVVHFAALKAVGESMARPLDYIETNLGGLLTLVRAMADAGVFRLVFSSSATVYGLPDILPVPEDAPLRTHSTYAWTKLAGEQALAQIAAADPRWAVGVLRYFNPAGAHASALIGEDPADIPNNLMPYLGKVALGELPELTVFGDDYETPDGTGVRDYIHIEDLAHGHRLSLEALAATGQGHVVNLGTGRGYSVHEMIAAYSRAVGRELPWRVGPRRPGDVAIYYADPARAERLLGFRASRGPDAMCASAWAFLARRTNARRG